MYLHEIYSVISIIRHGSEGYLTSFLEDLLGIYAYHDVGQFAHRESPYHVGSADEDGDGDGRWR